MKLKALSLIFLFCFALDAEAKTKAKKKKAFVPTYSSIVIDAHTGKILFSEQPDVQTYPASLTKMMTLYLLFEALERGKVKINQQLYVSKHASQQSPSKLYLKPGDSITVNNAILALMTKSANDVAVVVAEALGGSEEQFADIMSAKARKLGMTNTIFKNASGLPNLGQKTCARDMAKLSQALFKDYPRYYRHFQTKIFSYKGQKYRNHNALLGKVPGVDGIKTGFINASGWNLAASAVRSGHRVIAVVLGGKNRIWRDRRVEDLIEIGFKSLTSIRPNYIPMPVYKPAQYKPETAVEEKPAIEESTPIPESPTIVPLEKPIVEKPEATVHHWAIQVGAFKSARQAQNVAVEVQQKVPSLRKSKVVVSRINHTRGKLFQSRLTNLKKDEAQRICPKVVQAGHNCMPLRVK